MLVVIRTNVDLLFGHIKVDPCAKAECGSTDIQCSYGDLLAEKPQRNFEMHRNQIRKVLAPTPREVGFVSVAPPTSLPLYTISSS